MILEFCLPKIKMTKWSNCKQTTTIGRYAVLSIGAEIAPLCLDRHSLQKTLDVGQTEMHAEASPSSTCHARTAVIWSKVSGGFDFMTVNDITISSIGSTTHWW